MITNWIAEKTQPFLPISADELDELTVSFDFALSPEMMAMLYAQNAPCPPAKTAAVITPTSGELDEHERALV